MFYGRPVPRPGIAAGGLGRARAEALPASAEAFRARERLLAGRIGTLTGAPGLAQARAPRRRSEYGV